MSGIRPPGLFELLHESGIKEIQLLESVLALDVDGCCGLAKYVVLGREKVTTLCSGQFYKLNLVKARSTVLIQRGHIGLFSVPFVYVL